ncbi:Sulfate/thiosulfate import ATP-binding protein CysA [uncultured Clostridium sp.]|nr:Sulfate/thiosulfate import ATP-binding protein CysA [uncultured Clostridium sp.]
MRWWAVAFWLLAWQILSMQIGQEILIVSPVATGKRLIWLICGIRFWKIILHSTIRIMGGFLLGIFAGSSAAVLAFRYKRIEELCYPMICVMKTTPVASVIILLLMWISSGNLSVCIVFLMTFPILYTNVLEGLQHLNPKLNEMAEVFELPVWVRLRWIGIPQLMPYIKAGCALGIGLAWKAGTAAEVIGISGGTIGEKLYQAKIYLETADLLAWTTMILVMSYLFEKLFLGMLDMAGERLKRIQISDSGKTDEVKNVPVKEQQDIILTHLSKSYGEHCVIQNLSRTFPRGQTTCIMAPSGAGKTTLLRLLMGLEVPNSGRITGMDGRKKSAVFQEQIFGEDLSVYANIRIVRKRKLFEPEKQEYEKIKTELEAVGLLDCMDQKVKELSFGMRQRVALVRAFYADWDVLFLDEPFRGLDRSTRELVMEYTKRKCSGKQVLFVTHDAEEKKLVIGK